MLWPLCSNNGLQFHMPFFSTPAPKNSKKEVKALADIYGAQENNMSDFTPEEIEKMRETVLKADRAKITNNVFDLSKPPVVPYRHQEFPKLVYDHANSEPSRDIMKKMGTGNEELVHIPAKHAHRIVRDEKELAAALKAGFQEDPAVLEHVGIGAEEAEEDETTEEEVAATPRKKPGRKPKAQTPEDVA